MKQLESCQQEGSWTRLLFWLLVYLESTRKRSHFLLMNMVCVTCVPCILSTAHCFSVSFPKSLGWVKYLIMHWHGKKDLDYFLNLKEGLWEMYVLRKAWARLWLFHPVMIPQHLWVYPRGKCSKISSLKDFLWYFFFALPCGLFTVKTRKLCKIIWKKNWTFSPNIFTRH